MKDMTKILESISSDVLSDEVKASIANSFDTAVNEAVDVRVNQRVELECKNLSEKIDQEHTEKVQNLIEAMDKTHTEMFKSVVNKIDASHTKKLKTVVEKFQKELTENANDFKDGVVSKISKFLDLKIDEMVPQTHLQEAVENIQSRKLVSEIKKLLSYDPDSINDDVKTALKEGYDAIESLKSELNDKAKQNLLLKEEVNQVKAHVLLENKTKGLPESKRNFVEKFMRDKTPDYIENNFQYVVEMFEENEKSEKEILAESAKGKSFSRDVSVPPSQIKDEVIQESSTGDDIVDYLSEMQQQDKFYK
jgi:hypothetical protein